MPRSHRYWRPEAHQKQRPQAGMNDAATWSPTASVSTPGRPRPRRRRPRGHRSSGTSSRRRRPGAPRAGRSCHRCGGARRSGTCRRRPSGPPPRGGRERSISISSTFHGSLSPEQTAARVFMGWSSPCRRRPAARPDRTGPSIAPPDVGRRRAVPSPAACRHARAVLVEAGGQEPEGPVHLAAGRRRRRRAQQAKAAMAAPSDGPGHRLGAEVVGRAADPPGHEAGHHVAPLGVADGRVGHQGGDGADQHRSGSAARRARRPRTGWWPPPPGAGRPSSAGRPGRPASWSRSRDQLGVELPPDHVALGLVVAEERPAADPDGGGDVVDGGLVVARAGRTGRGRPGPRPPARCCGRRPRATSAGRPVTAASESVITLPF